MGVHGVLDGEFVQTERLGDALDLLLVGFVQSDPHEAFAAFAHFGDGLGMGPLAGLPHTVDVDTTVDDTGGGLLFLPRAATVTGGTAVGSAAQIAEGGNGGHGNLLAVTSWTVTTGTCRRSRLGLAVLGRCLPRQHRVGPEGRNAGRTRKRTIATAHCVLTSLEPTDGPRAGGPVGFPGFPPRQQLRIPLGDLRRRCRAV